MTIESVKDSDATTKKDASKLDSIQALRGIAILFVLLAHIKNCEMAYAGGHLPVQLGFGNMGVDVFFCISGYIMVTITGGKLRHNAAQVKDFFLKRLIRIYPIYWIFTVLSIVMWHSVSPPFYAFVPKEDFLSYYSKSFLLFPDANFPALNPGWSLVSEIYFYIIFGGFLFFHRKLLPWLLAAWAACVIGGRFLLHFYFNNQDGAVFKLVTNQMTLEFIAGCLIALFMQSRPRGPIKLLSLATIAALGITIAANPFGKHFLRIAWFGIPSALILFTCVLGEAQRGWRFPRWLVFAGDISYSLYLSHILTFTLLGVSWSRLVTKNNLGLSLLLSAILSVAAISVAALSYNFIEQPLLSLCRKIFLKPIHKARV